MSARTRRCRCCDGTGVESEQVRAERLADRVECYRVECRANGWWVSADDYVEPTTAAKLLNAKPKALANARVPGMKGPKFRKGGNGRIAYALVALATFVEDGETIDD